MPEATWEDVRRAALALPETAEALSFNSAHWRVRGKGFVWERPLRKKELADLDLEEQPGPIMGAKVEDEATKAALIADDPAVFFTTSHFDGYASVLVHLDRISVRLLEEVVTDAWLASAPPKLAREWLASHPD